MIVLDTNVLSELMRRRPDPRVVGWVDELDTAEVAITAVTAAELRAGVALLPRGRRRSAIAERVDHLVDQVFSGRVLPFDVAASAVYAVLVETSRRRGRPMSGFDTQIAAVCRCHGATLATRNVADFATTDLTVVDPWVAAAD